MSTIKEQRSAIIKAAFFMGILVVSPVFLIQTAVFTQRLGASFGFAILVSIIFDIGVQMNIWRVIIASNMRGQEIVDMIVPGLGSAIGILIVLGGLAFNVGNIAGAGLGLEILIGISSETGAMISGAIAIAIFLFKDVGNILNKFIQYAVIILILLTVYVIIKSPPPITEIAFKTLIPDEIDLFSIIALVGGTIGGYITFAGAHRLLDSDIHGKSRLSAVTNASLAGIFMVTIIRILLFLAVLGVIYGGYPLSETNPLASIFGATIGKLGYYMFGVVMWAAAIAFVIGVAHISISFLQGLSLKVAAHQNQCIILFILLSTILFVLIGKPIQILLFAGALNGLIVPVILAPFVYAAYQRKIVRDYDHPIWMMIFGIVVVALMAYLSLKMIYHLVI